MNHEQPRSVPSRAARLGALALLALGACAAPDGPAATGPQSIDQIAAAPERHDDTPRILAREPWTFSGAEGEVLRTYNYRLYTTESDRASRDRTALFLEYALRHYRTAIAPLPAPNLKLDTYLMRTRPQWERVALQLMGPQAEQLLQIQRGGFASRGIGVYYDLGLRDTLSIAAHEGWHQYTQRTFADPLPAWLEEGIATYMEGHRWSHETPMFLPWANVGRYDVLRDAHVTGNTIPVAELFDSHPQDFLTPTNNDVVRYYAHVWALTHFLHEGAGGRYAPAFRRLLIEASEGRSREALATKLGNQAANASLARRAGPGVALTYFNDDLEEFQREFDAFVAQVVSTGSRDAIVVGRSPL